MNSATITSLMWLSLLAAVVAVVECSVGGIDTAGPATAVVVNELPAFYATKTPALRFMITRGSGISAQAPLSFSLTAGTNISLLQLQVARTFVDFDYVNVNDALYAKALSGNAAEDACHALRTALPLPGAKVETAAGTPFSISAGPRFDTTCGDPVYFHDDNATVYGAHTKAGWTGGLTEETALENATVVEKGRLQEFRHADKTRTPRLGFSGAQSFTAVGCSAADLESFDAISGHHGRGGTLACVTPEGSDCDHIADFQRACAANTKCSGYTVAVVDSTSAGTSGELGTVTEVPVKLHSIPRNGEQSAAVTESQLKQLRRLTGTTGRIPTSGFYRKVTTEERTCRFKVTSAGRLEILVLQSSMSIASVSIYRDSSEIELLGAQCGTILNFAGNRGGRTGDCKTHTACTAFLVAAGDVVNVVPNPGVSQFGCLKSLGVVARLFETTQTEAPTTEPAFEKHDVTGFSSRSVMLRNGYLSLPAVSSVTLPVVVAGVKNLTLKVAQTRYECREEGGDKPKCASNVITVTSAGPDAPSATCGGDVGFPRRAGLTGQCSLELDCTRQFYVPASRGTTWAQQIEVVINAEALRSAGTPLGVTDAGCAGFLAELYVDASGSGSVLPAFPLLSSDDDATILRPVLVLPALDATKASPAELLALVVKGVHLVPPQSPAHRTALLTEFIGTSNTKDVGVFVDWEHVQNVTNVTSISSAPLLHALHPNVTYACILDVAPSSGIVTCDVPVPATATSVSVEVMQTDFSGNVLEIDLLKADGEESQDSIKCGGSSTFQGFQGESDQCATYLTCRAGLFAGAAAPPGPQSDRPATLHLELPQHMTNGQCDYAAVVVVTFKAAAVPAQCDASSQFTCVADGTCADRTAVCDDVANDCNDNTDESSCNAFTWADSAVLPNVTMSTTLVSAATTYTLCRREAVIAGMSLFAFSAAEGCRLLNSTAASALVAAPHVYTEASSSDARMYVSTTLVTPRSKYKRCTPVLHCSGRGAIRDKQSCACDCLQAFTGAHCEAIVESGEVAQYVAVVARSVAMDDDSKRTRVSLSSLQAALVPSTFGDVSVTAIDQPWVYNDTHAAFPFTPGSSSRSALLAFTEKIFEPDTLASINQGLKDATGLNSTVSFIFGIDAPNNFVSLGSCSASADGTVESCPTPTVNRGTLLVTASGIESFNIEATAGETSRRSGGTALLNCTGSSVAHGEATNKCAPSTCVSATGSALTLAASALSVTNATVSSGCDAPKISVSLARYVDPASTTSTDSVTVDNKGTSVYVVAAAVLAVAAAVFIVLVSLAVAMLFTAFRRAAAHIAGGMSARHEAWLLAREMIGVYCSRDAVVVAFATAVLLVALGSGFFAVLYVTSRKLTGNTYAVLEYYPTSECEGALLKTLPTRVTAIEAVTECRALTAIGSSDSALYGSASCVDVGGKQVPAVHLSRTLSGCHVRESTLTQLPPDMCVLASKTLSGEAGYVRGRCVTEAAANARVATVALNNPLLEFKDPVNVTASAGGAAAGTQSSRHTATAQVGFTTVVSTSSTEGTAANIAESAQFVGDFAPMRLVHQDDEAFDDARSKPLLSSLETTVQSDLTRLDKLTNTSLGRMVPDDGDYPVGFIFGSFGTATEISGDDTAPGAHRYRGIQNTAFDLGAHFQPDPTDEGAAATVQLWLRATTSTRGFAFAIADGYEDSFERTNPVVDRLMDIAAGGSASNIPWFTESWRAYGALYVDGAAKSLQFLFADPTSSIGSGEEAVVRAQWDTVDMGATHIFNGRWHKISIGLRNEDGQFHAVITVDGRTSLSSNNWRKCLSRRPSPVTDVSSGNTTRADRAAVSNGGVLYVGYLNAGVRGVRVSGSYVDAASDVRSGTRAMRVHAATKGRPTIEAVACAMFFASVLTVAYIIYATVMIVRLKGESDEADVAQAHVTYDNHAEVYFGTFEPIPFEACCMWLDTKPLAMTHTLREVAASPASLGGELKLVMALWTARHAKLRRVPPARYPSLSLWRALLVEATLMSEAAANAADAAGETWAMAVASGAGQAVTAVSGDAANNVGNEAGNAAPKSVPTNVATNVKATVPTGTSGDASSGTASMGSGSATDVSVGGIQLDATLLTVVATLQASATYVTSFATVPPEYYTAAAYVGGFFTLSFEFFRALWSDPLGGPIVIVFAVVITVVAVAAVLVNDDRRFYGTVLRYRTRRDMLALSNDPSADVEQLARRLHAMLARVDPEFDPAPETVPFTELHAVHVVSAEERCALQDLEDNAKCGDAVTINSRDGIAHAVKTRRNLLCTFGGESRAFPDAHTSQSPGVIQVVGADADFSAVGPNHGPNANDNANRASRARFESAVFEGQDSAAFQNLHLAVAESGAAGRRNSNGEVPGTTQGEAADQEDDNQRAVAAEGEALRTTGFRCVKHERALLLTEYTDVYPYYHRRRCCAVVNGAPCGREVGMMYCCPHNSTDDEGRPDVCGYALCAQHIRAKGPIGLLLHIRSQVQRYTGQGILWIVELVIVVAALALYTPALRTCVMIVSCHPVYQCEFDDCWSRPTQRFAAAAYLSIVVIVLYGILFPAAFLYILYARLKALHGLFARPSYGGRYLQPVPSDDTPPRNAELQQSSLVLRIAWVVVCWTKVTFDDTKAAFTARWLAPYDHINEPLVDANTKEDRPASPTRAASPAAATTPGPALPIASPMGSKDGPPGSPSSSPTNKFAKFKSAAAASLAAVSLERLQRLGAGKARADLAERLHSIHNDEWQRFLIADRSVLSRLYWKVAIERLPAMPLLTVARFLLLVPPLLLEPSSAAQFACIGAGEIVFAIAFILAEPFSSPWMTITTMLGSLHQFLIVGLEATVTARANDTDLSTVAGILMLCTSGSYILAVLLIIVAVLASGFIATRLNESRAEGFFNRFNLTRPATAPVYLCPTNDVGQAPIDSYIVERAQVVAEAQEDS